MPCVNWYVISFGYDNIYISVITYIETLGYNFVDQSEKALIDGFLNFFPIVHTNIQIAQNVVVPTLTIT